MFCIENILSANYLDISVKLATVCVGVANFILAISIFSFNTKKDANEKERDRRIQWLKSLILDKNLEHLYEFFDSLEEDLNKLKEAGLNDDDKKIVEDKALDHFITFRRKFIDLIVAVDVKLYESLLSDADKLQGHISETIFDSGINLSHAPKFDEVMSEKLTITKTEFIKTLFNYRGEVMPEKLAITKKGYIKKFLKSPDNFWPSARS